MYLSVTIVGKEPQVYTVDTTQFLHHFQDELTKGVAKTFVGVASICGLVLGEYSSIPPFNGSIDDRIRDQHIAYFELVAERFAEKTNKNSTFFVAPGGIVTQTYPTKNEIMHIDLLNAQYDLGIEEFYNASKPLFEFKLLYDEVHNEWSLQHFSLIYSGISSTSQFWGIAGSSADFGQVLQAVNLTQMAEEQDMDFLVVNKLTKSTEVTPVLTSLEFSSSNQEELLEFMRIAQHIDCFSNNACVIDIFVRPKKVKPMRWAFIHSWIGVTAAILLTVLIFLIFNWILMIPKEFGGYLTAPRSAPFAIIIIGLQRDADVWEIAKENLRWTLQYITQKYKAYEVAQCTPGKFTFVVHTVDKAVEMGLELMELMHAQTRKKEYESLVRGRRYFFISCAVHWCCDVDIVVNPALEYALYRGKDILECRKLYEYAMTNAVTLTESAIQRLSKKWIQDLHSADDPGLEDVFFIVKKNCKILYEAFLFGTEFHKAQHSSSCSNFLGGSKSDRDVVFKPRAVNTVFSSANSDSLNPLHAAMENSFEILRHSPSAKLASSRTEKGSGSFDISSVVTDAVDTSATEKDILTNRSSLPEWVDRVLQRIYEQHPLSLRCGQWKIVKKVVHYFYFGYALLFEPFAPDTSHLSNIADCLASAFRIPRTGLYEHLAVHCAIEFLHSSEYHEEKAEAKKS